jgi:hypothetical protein
LALADAAAGHAQGDRVKRAEVSVSADPKKLTAKDTKGAKVRASFGEQRPEL